MSQKNPSSRWTQIRRQVCKQPHNNICWWNEKISNYCNSQFGEWWRTDAITENAVVWQDPTLSETSSTRQQERSQKGTIGTYTWSHPDLISKSAKSERSNILGKMYRMDFWAWKKKQGQQLCFFLHKNVYKVPGSYSENRHRFFKPSPATNVSSPSTTTSQEREFIMDSGASLHMMRKVIWLRKSKQRMTFLSKFNDWKNHPQYFRCLICAKRNGFQHEWHPGRPSYLIQNGKKIECNTDKHIPLIVQACKQPKIRPKLWKNGSDHQLWATTSEVWLQPFAEGFARRCSSWTDVSPADVALPSPAILPSAHPSAKPTSNRLGGKHDARKLQERHAKEFLTVGRQGS